MNILALIADLEEAVSPARLKIIARQFGLFDNQVEQAALADPTDGKYLTWICKLWVNGKIQLPEDAEKVHTRLSQFAKLSRTSTWTGPKDLNQFASYADLVRAIEVAAPGKKELVRMKTEAGVEFMAEKGPFKLYRITTPEAGAKHFRNTEWCVKDPAYFNDYGPPFYYLTEAAPEVGHDLPYQLLHIGDGNVMCMDVLDEPVPVTEFDLIGLDVAGLVLEKGSAATATNFALDHLKRRWPEAEELILTDARAVISYLHLLKGRWLEAEPVILAGGTAIIVDYVAALQSWDHWWSQMGRSVAPPWPDWRWPEGEAEILTDLSGSSFNFKAIERAVRWATNIIKGPWPEAEPLMVRFTVWASDTMAAYVEATKRGAWPEFEKELFHALAQAGRGQGSSLINGAIAYGVSVYKDRPSSYAEKLKAALITYLKQEQGVTTHAHRLGIGPLVRLHRDVLGWDFEQARNEATRIEAEIQQASWDRGEPTA